MKKIEYLICRSKNWGPTRKLHSKLGGSTTLDPRLNCQVYVCKDYGEFAVMNRDLVSRPNGYWCAVQVRDTETGEVSDPPNEFPLSEADSAMVGADAQENPTGPDVSRPSHSAPVGVSVKRSASYDKVPETPEEVLEEIFGPKVKQPSEETAPLPPLPEPVDTLPPPPKAQPAQAAKKKPGRPPTKAK